jgi:hypothetical protein
MTFSDCGNSTTESNQTVSVKTTGTGDTFVIPKAQTSGRLISNGRACYFDKVDSTEMALNILLETANPRETELVRSMMSYTGLPANFSIYRGDVSNALATQYQNERLIIYNKDLFSRIDRESDSYWSSVFIMAHEIGHHLSFNLHSSNSMESELEADRFAAAILYKMGADSSQVQLAVRSKFISNRVDTKTHPSKSRRLEAIQNSWLKSAVLSLDKASPPPPHDQDVFKELNIQQMWNITMCGDDFGPWVPEHDDVELIKSIEIQGIVLSKKDNNEENLNPEHQKMATILIQITGISETQENQIGLTVGEKSEFEAYYCESRVTANTNLFEEIFKPGRRIIFDAYGIAENDYFRVRIAKIRTAIQ